MSTNLKHAAGEAAVFLGAFPETGDDVDVRRLAAWPWPPLTLGTVRALYELAADICSVAGEYDAELVARRLG